MYFTIVFTIFGSSLSSARAPCSRAGDTTACAFPTPSATLFRIDAAENPIVSEGKTQGKIAVILTSTACVEHTSTVDGRAL